MSDSTSDSDVRVVDGGGAKARPKLRTTARRQAPWYSEAPTDESGQDDASVEEAVAASSSSTSARPKRKREEEPDEGFEVEEEEDMDDDDEDDEDEAEEEEEEEENDGRRRSGRTRNKVTSYVSSDDFDFDDYEDDVEDKPKRKRLSTTSKKPRNSGKSASSSKKRRRSHKTSDDDSGSSDAEMLLDDGSASDAARDIINIDDDDDDDDYLSSTKRRAQSKKPQQHQQQPPSDDEDEKSFIIDKLLAREVHTRNEWAKICANKKTRFLHNFSIFLPDDDEEETGGGSATAVTTAAPDQAATQTDAIDVDDGVEKFLVKWKNLSYLHTSWETEKDLLDVDKNAKGKLQRFREKEAYGFFTDNTNGDEYYNPEFRIVDRILDVQDRPGDDFAPADDEDDNPGKCKLQYFLVKWKALPYDQTTWEREDDVNDDAAVQEYNKRLLRAASRFRKAVSEKKQSSRHRRFKVQHFHAYTARNPPPKKESQTFELRDYQLTGVNWMLFNWYQNRNSMLADEMGLGKTVQTVMYLNHLAEVEQVPNPFLILAPLSTLSHWQREFENWTNLNAVVYHGSAPARAVLQNYEFFLSVDELARADAIKGRKPAWGSKAPSRPKRDCFRFDVLITSYEMCSGNDYGKLARIPWQVMVVDEAHRLKNRTSKLSSMLHKNFKFEKILLLTGTPLQNNVEELWTLLNFLDGDRFKSKEAFLEQFGDLKDSSQVEQLHGELKPFLLRRMKEDVEKSLAPKEETIIEVELTVLQKQYYRAIYEKNTEFLARGRKKGHAPSLMNIMMELRKCCNHAFLIKGAEEREISRLRRQFQQQQKQTTDGKNAKSLEDQEAFEREARELLVTSSGKLVLLDKLLPRLKENGHRVLIFSQFKIMLDILQDYLKLRSYRCERIDGNITGNDRQSAIDRFSDPGSAAFIMLLSTRAGGVGINLTAADTVIIYDSDWNPQNDLQAQARCHRIGQKKSVKIYRLLSPKTYELHMFHQASLKLGLDQAVLGGIRNNNAASSLKSTKDKTNPNARLSKEEIENLLKHGAYEMFKEEKEGESEAASKRFSEESIDQILSRSTTIVHDPKKAADSEKKSFMSSFSKATFVSSSNPDEVVDIDDPDFWTKVVGLKGVEEQERERAAVEASPLKRRRARRVKSYAEDQLQFEDGLSDDNSTSLGKSRKKGAKSQKSLQDAMTNVEVISDDDDYSDDEDASDDEDDDDELLNDDFMILGNKKRRRRGAGANRTKKKTVSNLPPLYLYKEIILELMFEFGYGRWEELQRNNPGLRRYPLSELQQFVYVFIASYVRLACAPTLASVAGVELTMYHIYNARVSPPPSSAALDEATLAVVGTVGTTTSPFLEKLGRCLDDYSRRFKFISQMIKDAGVSRLSDIVISPELHRDLPVPAKGDRQMLQKLYQIDRMFALTIFVRSKLNTPAVPVAILVSLLNDFQAVGDDAKVSAMIRAGELPPLRLALAAPASVPTAGGPAPAAAASVAVASDVNGYAASTASVAPEQSAPTVVTPSTATSSSPTTTATTSTSTTPTKDEALETVAADTTAPKPDGIALPKRENGVPSEAKSKDEADMEISASSASPSSETTSVSTAGDMAAKKEDAIASDEKTATSETSTTNAGAPSMPTVTAAVTGPKPEVAVADTPKPVAAAPVPQSTPKQQEQRRAALLTLQTLLPMDLGNADSVAPWWLSLVDDVMLVLYIYRNGWMKTRNVTATMARDLSLFGSRAAAYPSTEWPTIAVLNKRAKSIISLWMMSPRVTTSRKPVAHGSTTTSTSGSTSGFSSWVKSMPEAFAASTATHARAPAFPSLMQVTPHRQYQYQQQQVFQHQHQHQQQQQQQQQQHNARPKLLGSKHNQFAKLIFSYGIPDMRTCRTTQERLEKWRYFLQDALLDVANLPLERLLAEARDLERVCRERVHMSEGSTSDSFISPTKAQPTGNDAVALTTADLRRSEDRKAAESIFGGHRGYWMLSTTQCRRLLHRVELFRLLRTQILVLPPGQLVEVIGRVIKALQAKEAGPTYPIWWSSPRHDILLLQGVECYGLDDHLAQVWKLPLFAQVTAANASTPFPNSTWVENYVSTLASASRKLLEKARLYREEAKRRERMQANSAPMTVDMTGDDDDDDTGDADEGKDGVKAAARQREQEALQRVRDIGDMRAEDPMFTLPVRLRQLVESNEAAKAELLKNQERTSSNSSPSRSVTAAVAPASTRSDGGRAAATSSPEGEAQLMRSEDPYESEDVRKLWMKQIKQDEVDAMRARAASSPDASTAPTLPVDDEGSKKTPIKAERAVSLAAPPSDRSGTGRGCKASSAASTSSSLRRRPPPPTERKRALRSFELIVIDDSDDD